ncbi:hydroxylysine kinase [Cephus cinctus]|uniref:Hydroxylysine kinase n=1 Tax=Cephus cinctus TaxID=211228 RepID=A0AAJ7C3I7_CEPCN|nr:hydroxylysine kinase [Cephus cinctus]
MPKEEILLTPGQRIKPTVDTSLAINLVNKLYSLTVTSVTELNSYDDKNFHVICKATHENPWIDQIAEDGYVLKIMNSLDSRNTEIIQGQNQLMIFLNDNDLTCSHPVKNIKGAYYSLETLEEDKEKYAVRLLVYRPGILLCRATMTAELLRKVGSLAGNVDELLKKFHHPAYENHKTLWMLTSLPRLREFIYVIVNSEDRQLVVEVIEKFENDVLNRIDELDRGIIHGDLNEQNILVNENGKDIVAVIDFADTQKSCLVFELAIATCYMMLHAQDLAMGRHVLKGYQEVRDLNKMEKSILKVCICARFCQSLVLGVYTYLNDPQNEYLLITQKNGWKLLKKLWNMNDDEVREIWDLSY